MSETVRRPAARARGARNWRRARRLVQVLTFLLFVYLLLGTQQDFIASRDPIVQQFIQGSPEGPIEV